jgi:hypothetical protein
MMAGPAMAILEHLTAARWLSFARMDLLAASPASGPWTLPCLPNERSFHRGAADAMLSGTWFAVSF